jgi:hypothetical protein
MWSVIEAYGTVIAVGWTRNENRNGMGAKNQTPGALAHELIFDQTICDLLPVDELIVLRILDRQGPQNMWIYARS